MKFTSENVFWQLPGSRARAGTRQHASAGIPTGRKRTTEGCVRCACGCAAQARNPLCPRGRTGQGAARHDERRILDSRGRSAGAGAARNHKSASKPKNADAMDYKYATALEALIGYWHLMARAGKAAAEATETSTTQIAAASDAETHAADAQKRMEEIICRAFAEIER